MKGGRLLAAAEILLLVLTALFMMHALNQPHPEESGIRGYMVDRGSAETGAMNLVTGIYLGYRAFDTFGEAVVLLISVTGVLYFLLPSGKENAEKEDVDP